MTVGSKSKNTALGTYLDLLVSEKNVEKELESDPFNEFFFISPSGFMECSMQYSSQQALPTYTPAYPT